MTTTVTDPLVQRQFLYQKQYAK